LKSVSERRRGASGQGSAQSQKEEAVPDVRKKQTSAKPAQEKALSHTEKLKAERERKRKEKEIKDQAKLLEIEAKIARARDKMELAKVSKSKNAQDTRPGNRRQREMNDDFGDVYNNNEASVLSEEEPKPRGGLPPRGSGA
jgi:serine phosphatase RsbU (regulator of sigma subunit)